MDMTRAEVIVEVKIHPDDDPFVDKPKGGNTSQGQSPHERSTILGGDVRGQIITYATAQLAAQYRTHAFSVIIVNDGARLIRWDRAGAIFTRKFDYRKFHYLAEFFWRYNRATRAARGHDESVTMAHGLDDELVIEARAALGCAPNDSLYRFEVVDEVTGEKTYYLGKAPSFKGNKSLTGRSTRGIVVYDLKNRKVAYLKDTWRVCGTGYDIDKEGDTYRKLKAAGVRNVPTVVAFGDVGDEMWHRTQTDIFARKRGSFIRQLRGHRHCRLVFREVGRDLTSFETTGEIVGAIADAVEAHQDAYELAGILHRDISVGNILITDNGGGLLIDWDLSKEVQKMGVPRQVERTGTWQFMSAKLLMTPTPDTHELADDLESFYHVLTWVTLRYTPHGLDDGKLVELIYRYFDDSWFDAASGKTRGGQLKRAYLTQREMRNAELPQGELAQLIDDLAILLRIRYEDSPSAEEIQVFESLQAQAKLLSKDDGKLDGFMQSLFERDPVWQYREKMKLLQTSHWIRNRFRQSADRRHVMKDTWTRDRDLGPPGTTSMRRPKESEAYTNQPKQPRKYGFKSPEGTEETPSAALVELPDSKRPKQLPNLLPEDDEEATWAPDAPDIIDGQLVFPKLAGYEEDKISDDEGYDSAWAHELDEIELTAEVVDEEDETAEPL
uniref:Protein kinase domain-containing protein n=1 Tax=Moniliophthora roreri TaxID=221103 RepID=A0A0W0GB29_MONRR